jgi:hypothetical protein
LKWRYLVLALMKGPFAVDKEYPSWEEDGTYSPTTKDCPCHVSHVSVWNFYPDPDAANMDDAQYVIERHKTVTHTVTCT